MRALFLLTLLVSYSVSAENAFDKMMTEATPEEKIRLEELNKPTKKEDCKDIFLEKDKVTHTGLCIKFIASDTEVSDEKKDNKNVKAELDPEDLHKILFFFQEMMKADDENLKNIQILIKGFPIKYEDLVTGLFAYYLDAFTKYNDKEKAIDSYLDNCTHLNKDEKDFIRMFLIMDFEGVKIKDTNIWQM